MAARRLRCVQHLVEFKLAGYADIHVEAAEAIDFAHEVALLHKPVGDVLVEGHEHLFRLLCCSVLELLRNSRI
jgi:hypothetical protein